MKIMTATQISEGGVDSARTLSRRNDHYLDPFIETPGSSITSPRLNEPMHIDLDAVTAKLHSIPDRIQTPIMTPAADEAEFFSQVDKDWEILRKWGLSDMEINQARRWEQQPLHESAELIHMRLLAECAMELSESNAPASLPYLFDTYDRKMIEYCRRRDETSDFGKAQERAQRAVNNLVAKMRSTGSSWKDLDKFNEATMGGQVTLNIVTEFCEFKLRDLEQRHTRAARRNKTKTIRPSRRSRRLRKLPPH